MLSVSIYGLCLYLGVYISVSLPVCVYICLSLYLYVYVRTNECIYVWLHECVYVYAYFISDSAHTCRKVHKNMQNDGEIQEVDESQWSMNLCDISISKTIYCVNY